MAFPGEHNRWHPYGGIGFTLNIIADADGQPPFGSVDDLAFTQAMIQQDKVSFSPLGIAGAQYRFTGLSVFGQATVNRDPAQLPALQRTAGQLLVRDRRAIQRRIVDRQELTGRLDKETEWPAPQGPATSFSGGPVDRERQSKTATNGTGTLRVSRRVSTRHRRPTRLARRISRRCRRGLRVGHPRAVRVRRPAGDSAEPDDPVAVARRASSAGADGGRRTAAGQRSASRSTTRSTTRWGSTSGATPTGRTRRSGITLLNLLLHIACGLLLFGIIRRTIAPRSGGRSERRCGTGGRIRGAPVARPPDPDRSGGLRHSTHGAPRLALLRGDAVRVDSRLGLEEALGALVRRVCCRVCARDGEQRGHDHGAARRSALRPGVPRRVVDGAVAESAATPALRRVRRDGSHRRDLDPGRGAQPERRLRTRRAVVSVFLYTGVGDRALSPPARVAERTDVRLRRAAGGVRAAAFRASFSWQRARSAQSSRSPANAGCGSAFSACGSFSLLAPSSSVVPIKTEIAAERRIYLASAAIFVLVAIGAERLARRYARGLTRRARRVRRPGGGVRRRHRGAGPDVPQLGDALSRRDRQGARQSARLRRGRASLSRARARVVCGRDRQCFVRRSR